MIEFASLKGLSLNDLIADLFPTFGFDPLADRLIEMLFQQDKAEYTQMPINVFWRSTSPRYRKRIIDYVIRTSKWIEIPGAMPHYRYELTEMDKILEDIRQNWEGLLENTNDNLFANIEANKFRGVAVDNSVGVDDVLGHIELVSRLCSHMEFTDSFSCISVLWNDTIDYFGEIPAINSQEMAFSTV